MTLREIQKDVRAWLDIVQKEYDKQIVFEIKRDDSERFCVQMETKSYIGELSVSNPDWAPFRYIDFMILNINAPLDDNIAFCFYDDEKSTKDDIVKNLNYGIGLMANGC